MEKDVKALDDSVISQTRSCFNITSITQCVNELVFNSLDAKATAIAIRINFTTFKIQVIDNGKGLSKANLECVGIRYMTNKCHDLTDLHKHVKYYGFRGEALSSICKISETVNITTKEQDYKETYQKTIRNGCNSKIELVKERPSCGTTVTVEGFLCNLPVRQQCIKNMEIDNIKKCLESLIIIHPKVSFSLRNNVTGKMILSSQKQADVTAAFKSIHQEIDVNDFVLMRVTKNKITAEGLLHKQMHENSKLQYFYVNKRPVNCSNLQKIVTTSFAKLKLSKDDKNKHPIYIILIKCPHSEIDLLQNPSKTTVQFKHFHVISQCIEKMIYSFLGTDDIKNNKPRSSRDFKSGDCGVSQIAGVIRAFASKRKLLEDQVESPEQATDQSVGGQLEEMKKQSHMIVNNKQQKEIVSISPSNANSRGEEEEEEETGPGDEVNGVNADDENLVLHQKSFNNTLFTHHPENEDKGKELIMDMFIKSIQVFPNKNIKNLASQHESNTKENKYTLVTEVINDENSEFLLSKLSFTNLSAKKQRLTQSNENDFVNRRGSEGNKVSVEVQTSPNKSLIDKTVIKYDKNNKRMLSKFVQTDNNKFSKLSLKKFETSEIISTNTFQNSEIQFVDDQMETKTAFYDNIENESPNNKVFLPPKPFTRFVSNNCDYNFSDLNQLPNNSGNFPFNFEAFQRNFEENIALNDCNNKSRLFNFAHNEHHQTIPVKDFEITKPSTGNKSNKFNLTSLENIRLSPIPKVSQEKLEFKMNLNSENAKASECFFKKNKRNKNILFLKKTAQLTTELDDNNNNTRNCSEDLFDTVDCSLSQKVQRNYLELKQMRKIVMTPCKKLIKNPRPKIREQTSKYFETPSYFNKIIPINNSNQNLFSKINEHQKPKFQNLVITPCKLKNTRPKRSEQTSKYFETTTNCETKTEDEQIGFCDTTFTINNNKSVETDFFESVTKSLFDLDTQNIIQGTNRFDIAAIETGNNFATNNKTGNNEITQTVKCTADLVINLAEKEKQRIPARDLKLEREINKPLITQSTINDWMKQTNNLGNIFYLNKRTGMISFNSPKYDVEYDISKRLDFVPKGLSPILIEKGIVDTSLSPDAKENLQNAILESYEDELLLIKWQNYIESNNPKQFFDELYKEKAKLIEDIIPNINKKSLPAKHIWKALETNYCFTKDLFNNLEFIGQVDCKFIAALDKSLDLLFLFDQHAVHERIRLELLLEGYKNSSVKLSQNITIFLPQSDLLLIKNQKSSLNYLGIYFELFTNGIIICQLPMSLYNKIKNKNVMENLSNLAENLVKEIVDLLKVNNGVLVSMPPIIQNAVNMEACRGAIKFGDSLTKEECELHLKNLSNCKLPFQCAHGRPTLAPLIAFDKNNCSKVPELNLRKLLKV